MPTESLRKNPWLLGDFYQVTRQDRVKYEIGLVGPKSDSLWENCRTIECPVSLALKLMDGDREPSEAAMGR